jgi:hypothetical protein
MFAFVFIDLRPRSNFAYPLSTRAPINSISPTSDIHWSRVRYFDKIRRRAFQLSGKVIHYVRCDAVTGDMLPHLLL